MEAMKKRSVRSMRATFTGHLANGRCDTVSVNFCFIKSYNQQLRQREVRRTMYLATLWGKGSRSAMKTWDSHTLPRRAAGGGALG